MADDDEIEFWKEVLSLLNGLHQDRVINQSELGLLDTPPVDSVPMPETCHPALSHAEDFVRKYNRDHVRIMGIKVRGKALMAAEKSTYPTSVETNTAILTRKKFYGPAPFVGDPLFNDAAYFWPVWVDDYGRHIAGEATLQWRYP